MCEKVTFEEAELVTDKLEEKYPNLNIYSFPLESMNSHYMIHSEYYVEDFENSIELRMILAEELGDSTSEYGTYNMHKHGSIVTLRYFIPREEHIDVILKKLKLLKLKSVDYINSFHSCNLSITYYFRIL